MTQPSRIQDTRTGIQARPDGAILSRCGLLTLGSIRPTEPEPFGFIPTQGAAYGPDDLEAIARLLRLWPSVSRQQPDHPRA